MPISKTSFAKNQIGLSITEVMVALVILMVGILPVFKLYDTVSNQGKLEKSKAYAMALAAEHLENAKNEYVNNPWLFGDLPDVGGKERYFRSGSSWLVGDPVWTSIDPVDYNGNQFTVTITDEKVFIDNNSQRMDTSAARDNDPFNPRSNQLIKLNVEVTWSNPERKVTLSTYATPR